MSNIIRRDNFSRGIDNVASPNKLRPLKGGVYPVAGATNVDFFSDGRIVTRLHQHSIGVGLVGAVSIPYKGRLIGAVLTNDGRNATLQSVDLTSGNSAQLPAPAPIYTDLFEGAVVVPAPGFIRNAVVHNDVLYMEVLAEDLKTSLFITYDGSRVGAWGVPPPTRSITDVDITTGASQPLLRGVYRVALSKITNDPSVEAVPSRETTHRVGNGEVITVSPDESVDVWCSTPDGNMLYWVGTATENAPLRIDGVVTFGGRRLPPENLSAPISGTLAASYNACILIASGRFLYKTVPFRPHVIDALAGFLNFPSRITGLAVVSGGVYVLANGMFFISGLDTDAVSQTSITVGGAPIPGSLQGIDSERVMWMAADGFVTGNGNGAVENTTAEWFTPVALGYTATGLLRRDGQRFLLVSAKPPMAKIELAPPE